MSSLCGPVVDDVWVWFSWPGRNANAGFIVAVGLGGWALLLVNTYYDALRHSLELERAGAVIRRGFAMHWSVALPMLMTEIVAESYVIYAVSITSWSNAEIIVIFPVSVSSNQTLYPSDDCGDSNLQRDENEISFSPVLVFQGLGIPWACT
ncbi:hypothetical protein NL676_008841 [Syzygium grande]|nr:hypothetical protein NL676_008841 [Syzygium grande]